jgi:hypothetical protein
MNTKNRHIALAAAVICAAALAGCGHDNAKTTVSYLVNHPDKIQDQQNWCGQQAHPSMIYGCQAIRNAKILQGMPDLLAEIGKPQPLRHVTFEDVMGSLAMQDAVSAPVQKLPNYQKLPRVALDRKVMQQYPHHPYTHKQIYDIINWCGAQARLDNEPPGPMSVGKSETCHNVARAVVQFGTYFR